MALLLVFKVLAYGRTEVSIYGQSRDIQNFLRNGAPLLNGNIS